MAKFAYQNISNRIRALLQTGITPEKLALSIVAGLVLGVFPILGTTSLLCAAAAWRLGLNLPAIQLVNYLSSPLQLILLLPLIRLGDAIFGTSTLEISPAQIAAMTLADLPETFVNLWVAGLHAATAWLLIAPALGALAYHPLAAALRPIEKAIVAGRLRQDAAQECL